MINRPTVRTEVFEGPMDLLMYLISKNKVSVFDIPIALILDQYNEYLNVLRADNIEIASEFLQMASRLVYIKSTMLLPRSEEGEQMKSELAAELMEYQVCRAAAEKLQALGGFDTFVRQPAELEGHSPCSRRHEASFLAQAYLAASGRGKRKLPPDKNDFRDYVSRPIVSVVWGVYTVLKQIKQHSRLNFNRLFSACTKRDQMVAVFIATLELIKNGRLEIDDSQNLKLHKEKQNG